MHGTLTGKRFVTSYHGKRSTYSNKLLLWVGMKVSDDHISPASTDHRTRRRKTRRVDRVNGRLDYNSLSIDHTHLQTWSSENDLTRRQASTFTVNFKTTDQSPMLWMLWIESEKLTKKLCSRKMFQTSDTPTRSFKSQFRSEEIRITTLQKPRQHMSCCYWRRNSIRWNRSHD